MGGRLRRPACLPQRCLWVVPSLSPPRRVPRRVPCLPQAERLQGAIRSKLRRLAGQQARVQEEVLYERELVMEVGAGCGCWLWVLAACWQAQ